MSQSLVLYMGSLALRSIGIAVIAGLCSWKMRNVAMRHAVWVVVLGAILLMPAFDYLLPATWAPNRIQHVASEQAEPSQPVFLQVASIPASRHLLPSTTSSPVVPAKSLDWWKWAAATYALVAFAMFMALVLAYRKIWNLRRTGTPASSSLWDEIILSSRITWRILLLLESGAVRVPITIRFLKPVVLLPTGWESWDKPKLMAVLSHEFAHVRRGDWVIAAAAAIAKCAYWMNPLSWFLERHLSQLAEQASDDAAIGATLNTTRYAEILLEFAAAAAHSGRYLKRGVAMAQHKTRARIERVLSNEQSGTGILKVAGWMLVLILATPILYSAAALQVSSERAPIRTAQIKPLAASRQPVPLPVPPSQTTTPFGKQAPVAVAELQQLQARQQAGPGGIAAPNQFVQSDQPVRLRIDIAREGGPYVIKPGDVLNIFVWKEPAVSTKGVTVQPDGQISIPLVQDISAGGSTPGQLKAEIEKRLQEKIVEPNVTVMVESIASYRVYVVGQVQKPGPVTSEAALTVLQALALAGGFQPFAQKNEISIIRTNESISTTFRFNYSNAINGTNPLENINLRSGDVVVVP